jgi:hypothetical protein
MQGPQRHRGHREKIKTAIQNKHLEHLRCEYRVPAESAEESRERRRNAVPAESAEECRWRRRNAGAAEAQRAQRAQRKNKNSNSNKHFEHLRCEYSVLRFLSVASVSRWFINALTVMPHWWSVTTPTTGKIPMLPKNFA